MSKTILLTGATDGIGRKTAEVLAAEGHHLLLHGRNPQKLTRLASELSPARVNTYVADLSDLAQVDELSNAVRRDFESLDVLINNAGVFVAPDVITKDRLDLRFVVNTIAPYQLTRALLPLLGARGRVINLSSAAQDAVDLDALSGERLGLSDRAAYGQSKLAITAWTRVMAQSLGEAGPLIVSVNPGSLLATKMVKDAFGVPGGDIAIGADILRRAALSDEFEGAQGQYFDNDAGRFAPPHPAALDDEHAVAIVKTIEDVLARGRTA